MKISEISELLYCHVPDPEKIPPLDEPPKHTKGYVVVTPGETFVVPSNFPSVLNRVPVQVRAFADDQMSVLDCPLVIIGGFAVMVALGVTADVGTAVHPPLAGVQIRSGT